METSILTDEQCQTLWEEAKAAGTADAQVNMRQMGKGGQPGTADIIITLDERGFTAWCERNSIGHKRETGVLDGWEIPVDFEDPREGARLAVADGIARVLRENGMEVTTMSMHNAD